MNRIKWLAAVPVLLAAVGLGGADQDLATTAERTNRFAIDLYAELKGGEGNLFLSPYGISTALTMTYAGARGETAKQMARVLHLSPEATKRLDRTSRWTERRSSRVPWSREFGWRTPFRESAPADADRIHAAVGELMGELNGDGRPREYELVVSNALWGQEGYPFLDDFLDLIDTYYGGAFHELDFYRDPESARLTINDWVAEETHDKIEDLIGLGGVDRMTRLVLTNAIYFKSTWAYPFHEGRTSAMPFYRTVDDAVDVFMMRQQGPFPYLDGGDFQALELSYEDFDLSMVVLLPDDVDGLTALEDSLTPQNLTEWLSELQPTEVLVEFPRFEMESEHKLKDPLSAMGMAVAFDPRRADFSGMAATRELVVQDVLHKAFVKVDEDGTEAAAATAVVVGGITSVGPGPSAYFRADHPFFFLIRDCRTGTILFLGRLVDPD